MRAQHLLWLPLLTSCADSGHTRTVLVNASAAPLVLECTADTASARWRGLTPDRLGQVCTSYQADTCFFTQPAGKLVVVKTLAGGDSLQVGEGQEVLFNLLTKPPLEWEAVTVQAVGRQPVRLTAATLQQFIAGAYEERAYCCGEYLRITQVYQAPFPISD